MVKLDIPDEVKDDIRKILKNGSWIFQPLKHTCGYRGNSYVENECGWKKRTHCPQCNEELTWISLEQAFGFIEPRRIDLVFHTKWDE